VSRLTVALLFLIAAVVAPFIAYGLLVCDKMTTEEIKALPRASFCRGPSR
jgi:hypothetical protein